MTTVSRTFRALAVTICCTASAFLGGGAVVLSATVHENDLQNLEFTQLNRPLEQVPSGQVFTEAIQCNSYKAAISIGDTFAKYGTIFQSSIVRAELDAQTESARCLMFPALVAWEHLMHYQRISEPHQPKVLLIDLGEATHWRRYIVLVPLQVIDTVFSTDCNSPGNLQSVEQIVGMESQSCWFDL